MNKVKTKMASVLAIRRVCRQAEADVWERSPSEYPTEGCKNCLDPFDNNNNNNINNNNNKKKKKRKTMQQGRSGERIRGTRKGRNEGRPEGNFSLNNPADGDEEESQSEVQFEGDETFVYESGADRSKSSSKKGSGSDKKGSGSSKEDSSSRKKGSGSSKKGSGSGKKGSGSSRRASLRPKKGPMKREEFEEAFSRVRPCCFGPSKRPKTIAYLDNRFSACVMDDDERCVSEVPELKELYYDACKAAPARQMFKPKGAEVDPCLIREMEEEQREWGKRWLASRLAIEKSQQSLAASCQEDAWSDASSSFAGCRGGDRTRLGGRGGGGGCGFRSRFQPLDFRSCSPDYGNVNSSAGCLWRLNGPSSFSPSSCSSSSPSSPVRAALVGRSEFQRVSCGCRRFPGNAHAFPIVRRGGGIVSEQELAGFLREMKRLMADVLRPFHKGRERSRSRWGGARACFPRAGRRGGGVLPLPEAGRARLSG